MSVSRPVTITALGIAQILGWGTSFYFPAVLAEPIVASTGWSLFWVVSGTSIGLLVAGLISPRVGAFIDRRGGRPVLALSSLLYAAGLTVIGLAPALPVYLFGWVLLGGGMGTGLYDAVFAALQAGARGYLLKGARRTELLRAVQAVAEGEAIFGPAIASRLMSFFATPRPSAAAAFPQLTARETEILRLIAQHVTNPEIADRLGLSEKTVRNHVSNVFTKLQVPDRARAIIAAREAGLQ